MDDEEDPHETPDDNDEDLNRALADIEILLSAFPDETELRNHNQQQQQQEQATEFPLFVTFRLSESAWIQIEFIIGYPTSSGLQIASYRSNPKETHRMEACVQAMKQSARECYDEQIEAALPCCLAAKDIWDNFDDINSTPTGNTTIDNTTTDFGGYIDAVGYNTTTTSNKTYSYPWVTTECITEKKSIFQAHVCPVKSEQDVKRALQQLLTSSTRIQRATHNMWAYRFTETISGDSSSSTGITKISKHDNDDDGEDAAGGRLAHLLQMRNEDGVLLVVSRWYGGIKLGPKRFAVITNIAREALVQYHSSTQ